jgi:hypothetical protein
MNVSGLDGVYSYVMKMSASTASNESVKLQMDCRSNPARPQRNGFLGLVSSELNGLTSRLQGILRDDGQVRLDTCQSPTSDVVSPAPISLDDSGDEGFFSETPMTDPNFDTLPGSGLHGQHVQRKASIDPPGPLDTVHPNHNTYSNLPSIDGDIVPNSGETYSHHQNATYHHVPQEVDTPSTDRPLHDDVAPVAIIGMSCRFPGDATTPERLWEMCANAREAWSRWPEDRFNQDAFFHPNPEKAGTVSTVDYCIGPFSNMCSSTLEVVTSSHRTWMSLTQLSLILHPQRPR